MSEDWIFVSDGMSISVGIKIKAKKGTLGLTTTNELVLIGDNSEVLDKAAIAQIEFKFGSLDPGAVSIKMNGKKWYASFEPPMKTNAFGMGGGLVGGMQHAQRDDVQAARVRREEFRALVEKA